MFEDITSTFERSKRQQYSNRYLDVIYLREYIYKNSNPNGNIKDYCKNIFPVYPGKKVFRVLDQKIKNVFLNEANLQLNKALYNWSIYKRLVTKGLKSWGIVTLYYAQFYSIIGLLNLQGVSLTRPPLLDNSKIRETQFHVYPEDFANGKIIFEVRNLRKPHEDFWQEYYNTYRRNRFNLEKYNPLYQYDNDNPLEPLKKRTFANYDISFPLIEFLLNREEIVQFASKMQQDIFQHIDYDDSDIHDEYIASLRINLLFDMINRIMSTSSLAPINESYNKERSEMFLKTKDLSVIPKCFAEWINSSA